jgi:hypothetical protein
MDTCIATMPKQFTADVGDGEHAVLLPQLVRFLRPMFEEFATNLGEELHHAEFVITTDPSTVQAKGSMHDCDECRAGVRRALRALKQHPDRELIVAALYWAGP